MLFKYFQTPQTNQSAAAADGHAQSQDRVRRRILPSLIIAILALQSIFVVSFFVQQQKNLQRARQDTEEYVSGILDREIEEALAKMETAMVALTRDATLSEYLKDMDLAALETQTRPLFEQFRAEQEISHFYFHRPDRTVALRLHSDKRDDLNNRTTIVQAEATGTNHAGLEQGKTGNAVLRSVYPWFDNTNTTAESAPAATLANAQRSLLGYLELGIEFEDILQHVARLMQVDLVLAIDKSHLDRDLWEAKATELGIDPGWEKFPSLVVTNNTLGALPKNVEQELKTAETAQEQRSLQYTQDGRHYQAIFIPFESIEGDVLGYVVAFKDITQVVQPAQEAMFWSLVCSLLMSVGIAALFYLLLGRVQTDLTRNRRRLTSANAHLEKIVADVTQASQALTSRSQHMSEGATQLLGGANHQATATEQASASVSFVVAKIRTNAESANQTQAMAQVAAQDAEGTRQAMLDAVQVMKTIAQKIAVVEEIASQTNVLALNAGIEATRTQENQGGLAVIATEIRKLAERAHAAAADINQLALSSVKSVQQAESMINKLVPGIQNTATLVDEISTSSQDQLNSAIQIDQAIQQLDIVTQQNSASAQELTVSADDIASQAAKLEQAIAAFHTGDESPQPSEPPQPAPTAFPNPAFG